mgnify:CR=1 FL=1
MKQPSKIWIKEEKQRSIDGEELMVISVNLSEVKDSYLVFLKK